MRILIAEDDQTSRTLLREALSSIPDTELIEAVDGLEAWNKLAQGLTPDLCIIDHMMPKMSGLELLEKMRLDPRLRPMPVMVCTSSSDRSTVARAARLRIRDYVLKPVHPASLQAKVETLRKELIARRTLEDATAVRARLNITEEAYRKQIATLVRQLNSSLAGICVAIGQGISGSSGVPITPLKRTCADLGASAMLTSLANLEVALHEASEVLSADLWPPSPGWIDKIQPLVAALEVLRVETERLSESVGPLPPPDPLAPPPPPPPAPQAKEEAPASPPSPKEAAPAPDGQDEMLG